MINPGELALATIGISAILRDEVPRQGVERLQRMAAIPKQILTLAGKVAAGNLTYQALPREHSYRALLDRLSSPLRPNEIQGLIDKFPGEGADIGAAFVIAAQQALQHVKDLFPVSVYTTFAGPKNMVPNDLAIWQFLSQLDVINDPMRVFALMSSGALLKRQADAIRLIYPTMSKAIDPALYGAISRRIAAKASYQLPPAAEFGVATWLGRRTVAYAPVAPAPPPSAAPAKAPKAPGLATPNQRAVET